MNTLPVSPLSPQQQRRRLERLYSVLASQVKSYHKARHMGDNSSVTVEFARELMASMEYTLSLVPDTDDPGHDLKEGQAILAGKAKIAAELFRLVDSTAPAWQGECRWDTIRTLDRYLQSYDSIHLAHRIPQVLFYPTPMPIPKEMQGIDHCIALLRILWLENQIMAEFPEETLAPFWSVFCQDDRGLSENQCQQLLIQVVGKGILNVPTDSLLFSYEELEGLRHLLFSMKDTQRQAAFLAAVPFSFPGTAEYVQGFLPGLLQRVDCSLQANTLEFIFLSENQV